MKIYTLLIAILIFTTTSHAVTKPKFLPFDRNLVVSITATDVTGASDNDATDLYNLMNVPEQDSSMGKGKSIKTPAKDFTLVCAVDKKTCSIVLNKTANTVIIGSKKYANFTATGLDAMNLFKQFKPNAPILFSFTATDEMFHMTATPDKFLFEIQAQ